MPESTMIGPRYAVRGQVANDGALTSGAVIVEGGRIGAVLGEPYDGDLPAQVIDAHIVAPGFIDLQVNGGFGVEADDNPESYRVLAARLPETGVTSWLPTVISSPPEFYPRVLSAFNAAAGRRGAEALGFHFEGPFLSPKQMGAHPPDAILSAPDALMTIFSDSPAVKLVTLAPERSGGSDRIRSLRQAGVVVSLGHTNATYEEFEKGINAGATMTTHLYNAMTGLHHRSPGAVGATLLDGRVVAGLIADGVHAHQAAVAIALRLKGPAGIALVTDMMSAAGMCPGTYPLGGRDVTTDGATARLPDGTLAGSLLTMDQAIRNLVAWEIATPAVAIQMATQIPAGILGLTDRGRLAAGMLADLVLLDERLEVDMTIVRGGTAFQRQTRQ